MAKNKIRELPIVAQYVNPWALITLGSTPYPSTIYTLSLQIMLGLEIVAKCLNNAYDRKIHLI